jgi:hypothetical protein
MATDTKFYPSLATLLPPEMVPLNLGFIQGALNDVFDHLFYRDLQVQKSKEGDVGFYQLVLVTYQRLGVEIPGTGGMALVLNPDQVTGTGSAQPVALNYRWPILKYVKGFDHASPFDVVRLAFNALVEISGVTPPAMLQALIDRFHGSAIDPVQDFVDAYNLNSTSGTALTNIGGSDPDAIVESILRQLDENQHTDLYELIFATYLDKATGIEDAYQQVAAFFNTWVRDLSLDDFEEFLLPHGSIQLKNISLALEFPRALLKPVNPDGTLVDANLPEALRRLSKLTFVAGSLTYSTDKGLQFDSLNQIVFDRSQIADTGVLIGFSGVKLDLSRTTNIPEATADGRPDDFMGAYIASATIDLPAEWFSTSANASASTAQIAGTDLIVGSGGTSGTIALNANGVFNTKLGNFEASLTSFDIKFERNAIVQSNIAGTLVIPGFVDNGNPNLSATISIRAHIAEDGDFSVTATDVAGIPLVIPHILTFTVNSLGFGRQDDLFFVTMSGKLSLSFGGILNPPVEVELKKLKVTEHGHLEFEGGAIVLPKAVTVEIGPVKLSVTALSMGSYERSGESFKYIGFDGSVNLDPGSVSGRASGVKIYWRTDVPANATLAQREVFVRADGFAVDIILPSGKSEDDAAVVISGFLQVKQPDPSIPGSTAGTEYAGGISLKLPQIGMAMSAAMRLNPSVPAFLVDTELSLSVPIPLADTDLGIYAFRLMLGVHYIADKAAAGLQPDADWYEYYKKKVALTYKEGITVEKFSLRPGFSGGAGLTIGTESDSGQAFSAKLFLLISDGVMLQGQAAIMSERVDLSPNDPPFTVFIAITSESLLAAFGVNYKLPEDSGDILDLQALIEMGFYFDDSSAWYIDIGTVDKPVNARLFTILNAYAYLSLSASGIKAGAGTTWDFDKSFGPVHIGAHAYLATQGHISFKPKQIGAGIALGGAAYVSVFKFKFGMSVAAALAAEAPHPFIVSGSVDVILEFPRPFKKLGGTFALDFTWNFYPSQNTAALPIFNEDNANEAAKAVSVVTRERFDVNVLPSGSSWLTSAMPPPPGTGWGGNFNDFIVPLDCTIDIEFKKPIAPGPGAANIGTVGAGFANSEYVPPQRGKSAQVQHVYTIADVTIRCWNPVAGDWEPYDIYAALTPLQDASFVDPADLVGLKQGWWQIDRPGKANKLSMLSQTPLSYANDTAGSFVPERSGITTETIYCPEPPVPEFCFAVDQIAAIGALVGGKRYAFNEAQLRIVGPDGQIVSFLNAFGLTHGVALQSGSQMEIFFPEATGHVVLRMATLADDVTIFYQQRRQTGVDTSQCPVFGYVTVATRTLHALDLLAPVEYTAIGAPIDKIAIIAGECRCEDGPTAAPSGSVRAIIPTPPPCGSLVAYLANILEESKRKLSALQSELSKMLAEAGEDEQLAGRIARCDPALATQYRAEADSLLQEAKAMKAEIDAFNKLIACCEKLSSAVRPTGARAARIAIPPQRDLNCNIDPKFNYTCTTIFFGFCWLGLQDQIYNETVPSFSDVAANNAAMARAVNKTIRPVLRPGTTYAITVHTAEDTTISGSGATTTTERYMHLGVRTAGPPGFFHTHRIEYTTLASQDRADEFRLQSLMSYVDYANSYPSPNGDVLNAKPLFCLNPKLKLFYIHQQVYTMYGGQFDLYNGNLAVTSTLSASILDPVNGNPVAPTDPGYVGPATLSFAANSLGHSDTDLRTLNNMATQGDPCTAVTPLAPMGISTIVTIERLKPLKLYLAVYAATYDSAAAEVLRYNFQSSRYDDFPAQINSYQLADRGGVHVRDAVYDDIAVSLDATRSAQLAALIANNYPSDALEQEFADPFDRLIDGILQIGPLDPPTTSEFNVVRDAATGNVLGLYFRGPEPVNDPRIPASDIANTITMTQQNSNVSPFVVFHSKDRSRAFIADPALNLQLMELQVTFVYLEYDGGAYVPASTVAVGLFQ